MKIAGYQDVPAQDVDMEGAEGVQVRWLIDHSDGAPNFAMRHFEIEAGGHTPLHHHPYEHEVFILEGSGTIQEGENEHPFKAGDSIYVASDELHQFRNTGEQAIRMICMVPAMNKC